MLEGPLIKHEGLLKENYPLLNCYTEMEGWSMILNKEQKKINMKLGEH